jgi:DNA (cytosine-5)-methyltransferase 1
MFFTLENVYAYRESQSWSVIARTVLEHGFSFNYWHCNLADWGVPQTRKRMIVIARRDGRMPVLPPATHAKNPQSGLFGSLLPWVGWYEAIRIHDLPLMRKSGLSRTQTRRVDGFERPLIIDSQNKRTARTNEEGGYSVRLVDEPCFSVTASWRKARPRLVFPDAVYLASNEHAAIWQAFPVCYQIPEANKALEGIGNAVPPLFYQRLAESWHYEKQHGPR